MSVKKKLKLKDDSIRVHSAADLLEADRLLSAIGHPVFGDANKRAKYAEKKDVDGHLMEDGDGWRIQSHYIGFGTEIDVLEVKIAKYRAKQETLFTEIEIAALKDLVEEKIEIREGRIVEMSLEIAKQAALMTGSPDNAKEHNAKIYVLSNSIREHVSVIEELRNELKMKEPA